MSPYANARNEAEKAVAIEALTLALHALGGLLVHGWNTQVVPRYGVRPLSFGSPPAPREPVSPADPAAVSAEG